MTCIFNFYLLISVELQGPIVPHLKVLRCVIYEPRGLRCGSTLHISQNVLKSATLLHNLMRIPVFLHGTVHKYYLFGKKLLIVWILSVQRSEIISIIPVFPMFKKAFIILNCLEISTCMKLHYLFVLTPIKRPFQFGK